MNIESLQIKRITGNWNEHKTFVPKDGEMIFIERGVITTNGPGYIVIGDGIQNVGDLVGDSFRVVLFKEEIYEYINDLYPESSGDIPGNISRLPNVGDSEHFARANHSHSISGETINSAVQSSPTLSEIVLRKVYAGTNDPSPNKGSIGDIYIKYEN